MSVFLMVTLLLIFAAATIFASRSRLKRGARPTSLVAEGGPRWTSGEIISVITAVVSLFGALGTLYTTVQTSREKELNAALAERDSLRGLVVFSPRTWAKLPRIDLTPEMSNARVDDRFISGDCDRNGGITAYDATGPSRLKCAKGVVRLQLTAPTYILLVPDLVKP